MKTQIEEQIEVVKANLAEAEANWLAATDFEEVCEHRHQIKKLTSLLNRLIIAACFEPIFQELGK